LGEKGGRGHKKGENVKGTGRKRRMPVTKTGKLKDKKHTMQ
jgi:hypothetical protein